jgi:hypothetical protein
VGVNNDQCNDSLGNRERRAERDHATDGETAPDSLLDAQLVQNTHDVIDRVVKREWFSNDSGPTVAAKIDIDQSVLTLEGPDLCPPHVPVAKKAVTQHYRHA